jgi:hypothetical protein
LEALPARPHGPVMAKTKPGDCMTGPEAEVLQLLAPR